MGGGGGGEGIFLQQGFESKIRSYLEASDTNGVESVFIEILQPCSEKNIVMLCLQTS